MVYIDKWESFMEAAQQVFAFSLVAACWRGLPAPAARACLAGVSTSPECLLLTLSRLTVTAALHQ